MDVVPTKKENMVMDDLSNKRESDKDPSGKLLGSQERLICEQIGAGQPPYSQRAQSLLAIDAGVTQKTAALQTGQTVGQVSYWLSKFRREGMSIFPEKLLLQTEPQPPAPQHLTETPTPSESPEIDQPVEQDAKRENEISDAAEPKPGKKKKKKTKKKSKKVKASKKSKKKKRNRKKKQVKKSKKRKKKSDKKK
jgi:septal ring-binding cell division protein DamX